MAEISNKKAQGARSLAGADFSKALETKLQSMQSTGIISSYKTKISIPHDGFEYQKQYLIDFLVETNDGKYIAIRNTNSFRTDRIKQYFYDIVGFKENSTFKHLIAATIFVVPDKELSGSGFQSIKASHERGEYYSPADHLLTASGLMVFLETYEQSAQSKLDVEKENIQSQHGRNRALAGIALEKQIVSVLNDKDNLTHLKTDTCNNPYFIRIVKKVLEKNQLETTNLLSISATDTVPFLKSGGHAKTDVIINLKHLDGELQETLSIKNTSKNSVSCHEYGYKDFVRVLECADTKLATYLELFHDSGSWSEMEARCPPEYSIEDFSNELKPKSNTLTQWALTGAHDRNNYVDSSLQISTMVFIQKKDTLFCDTWDAYIDVLSLKQYKLPVPFTWTYPSKRRGQKIQLKMPIILTKT